MLRYIRSTVTYSLHLRPAPFGMLSASSDADWTGNHPDEYFPRPAIRLLM
jgi:hypothetical protein